MLTSKNFKHGDILVSLGGNRHYDQKGPVFEAGVISKCIHHFNDNTLGEENSTLVTCSKLFRKATKEEILMYNNGIKKLSKIINEYLIY